MPPLDEPAAFGLAPSVGRERPPSPDIPFSSSANASKEMRSAAFLFGLVLDVSFARQIAQAGLRLDD